MENETETGKNANLILWEKVEKTPKELIKEIEADGGVNLKTIAPINKIKRATEIFGLYGVDFGLKEIKHGVERIFGNLVIGTLDAKFFCNYDNKEIEFEISNSISIVSQVDKQLKINSTYRKAIETDTIGKALSRLGFNADLYTDGEIISGEPKKDELIDMDLIKIGGDENETN